MPKLKTKRGITSDETVLGLPPKARATGARTSGRTRALSSGLRIVDAEARQAARSNRLEMYEADNYGEDGTAPAVDEDEEFFVDDHDTTMKSRTGTGDMSLGKNKAPTGVHAAALKKLKEKRARARKIAEVIGEEVGMDALAVDPHTGFASMPHIRAAISTALAHGQIDAAHRKLPAAQYGAATVSRPQYPLKPYCSECGMVSKYSCVRCGARYCCSKCGEQHKETRCLSLT